MLDKEQGRRRVRQAVVAAMSARQWNLQDLVNKAEVDRKTAGTFLSGQRWPQPSTLSKIEAALAWEPGTIARILEGEWPAGVGGPGEDAGYVAAPGDTTKQDVSNSEVLAELRAMREDVNALSRRVARIESSAEPLGGADGSP